MGKKVQSNILYEQSVSMDKTFWQHNISVLNHDTTEKSFSQTLPLTGFYDT